MHLLIRQTCRKKNKTAMLLVALWMLAASISAQFVTDNFHVYLTNIDKVVVESSIKNTGQVRNSDLSEYSYFLQPTTAARDMRWLRFMVKNIGSSDADMQLLKISVGTNDVISLLYSSSTLIVRRYITNSSYVDYKLLDKLFDFSQKATKPYYQIGFCFGANFMWLDVAPTTSLNAPTSGFLHSVCFFGVNSGGTDYMSSIINPPNSATVKLTFTNGRSEDTSNAINGDLCAINSSDLRTLLQDCYIGGVCTTRSSLYDPATQATQNADINSDEDVFIVYPNPSAGDVQVVMTASQKGKVRFTLTGATGQQAFATERMVEAGKQTIPLNMGPVAPGMYILRAVNANGGLEGQMKLLIK